MKINMPENWKRVFTYHDVETCKQIAEDLKEYDWKDSAQMAARVASGIKYETFEILKINLEFGKNNRLENLYTDDSDIMDVVIEFYAYSRFCGFYNVSCYLSDVWMIGGIDDDELRRHMYIMEYPWKR